MLVIDWLSALSKLKGLPCAQSVGRALVTDEFVGCEEFVAADGPKHG